MRLFGQRDPAQGGRAFAGPLRLRPRRRLSRASREMSKSEVSYLGTLSDASVAPGKSPYYDHTAIYYTEWQENVSNIRKYFWQRNFPRNTLAKHAKVAKGWQNHGRDA
jgi:hypothetical protein